MSLAKEYEQELLRSWKDGEEQVRQITYINRKVSMENKPRYHTRENHDFLISRYKRCIYCEKGCKIAGKEEVNKEL